VLHSGVCAAFDISDLYAVYAELGVVGLSRRSQTFLFRNLSAIRSDAIEDKLTKID